ncbi:MAG: nucleoside transporter C-terminal domain-containing protein [Bacteroidia bacterium]|nr:nucleoside transporter C-terminal domain-containing protein [Bacteroidia bacterium]
MNPRHYIYFLAGLFLLLSSSDLKAQANPDLIFDWKIISYDEANSSSSKKIGLEDYLSLKEDGSFSLEIVADSTVESGKWELSGDSLHLYYELIPIVSGIDSLVYQAQANEPSLIFFKEGQEIARQDVSGLNSKRRSQHFALSFDERTNPILTSSTLEIKLGGRATFIQSEFSFLDILRGIFGIFILLGICWLFSSNRKKIDWKLVAAGIGLQLVFALLLKVPFVNDLFRYVADIFVTVLNFTQAGSSFLFLDLVDIPKSGYIFAFQVLPIIIFFSALTSLLYYLGILQRIVYLFAVIMSKTMRLSGAESTAAAGNIFIGQTEAPLLVKPYLAKMTRSEIMSLMTGGMATIAGSVFGAYIGYLGGADPEQQLEFARHLLTASIMSAPAALVAAKMLVPETEEINRDLMIPKDRIGNNILDAITNGATDGLKLAVNVAVMLLVFIAMIKAVNFLFADVIGYYTGLNEWVASSTDGKFQAFSLEYVFGLFLAPIAWVVGVPTDDIMVIGQLFGEKTIASEFVAYASLGEMKAAGQIVHYKSLIIATYALCGFANFASIGIQIGGIGALAPNQRKTLSELGVKSMVGGTIAAFITAVLAGMLIYL